MSDKVQPTEEECKRATAAIEGWLRRNASNRPLEVREDIASAAVERWLEEEGKHQATQYAEWALQDYARVVKRRATFASDELDTQGVGGDRENALVEAIDGLEKAPKAQRARRYGLQELEELKKAVRAKCLVEFERQFGRAWTEDDERKVRRIMSSDEFEYVEEGIAVYEELRKAMRRAAEYVERERPPATRPPPCGLGWWVPENLAPLMDHAWLEQQPGEELSGLKESARQRLVALLGKWEGPFGPPPPPHPAKADLVTFPLGRRLEDAREFAVVFLLGGGWPEMGIPKAGVTPAQVLETEQKAFSKVRQALS